MGPAAEVAEVTDVAERAEVAEPDRAGATGVAVPVDPASPPGGDAASDSSTARALQADGSERQAPPSDSDPTRARSSSPRAGDLGVAPARGPPRPACNTPTFEAPATAGPLPEGGATSLATASTEGLDPVAQAAGSASTSGPSEPSWYDAPLIQREPVLAGGHGRVSLSADGPHGRCEWQLAGTDPAATQVQRRPGRQNPALGPEPEADPNDVDTSEFSTDPRAAATLATIPKPKVKPPPPAPTGPPPPARPKQPAQGKKTPKPTKGPRPKNKRRGGGPGAKGKGGPGEVVRKRAPPPPPKYVFKPGLQVPPPAPLDQRKPKQDPALAAATSAGKKAVKAARKHPTGQDESAASQLAAKAPANDTEAQAKAGHADTMAAAKPKEFSADTFYTAVKAALDKAGPKNFEEAENLDEKATGMKAAVKGTVTSSKDEATGDVATKANLPPDPSVAVRKPEAPMPTTEIAEPPPVGASAAMPAPVPSEQLDLREGPAKVDQQMADAGVTEEQLKQSNEPEFNGALSAKKQGEAHTAKAPGEIRQAEAGILGQAGDEAASAEKTAVGGARGNLAAALGQVGTKKDDTKDKDEKARKEVADNVTNIYDLTKRDVDATLTGLDKKVDTAFEQGEARIRKEFTADWNQRLKAYKSHRYSGIRGKWRWTRDFFAGLPEEASQEYEASRKVYEAKMDKLARDLSILVANELNTATRRIEKGRQDVATYVGGLTGELAKVGQEAAADLADKFDELDAGVKDKFDELATSISKKWKDSRDAVNKEIEEAKEANSGIIAKASAAIAGVLNTINNLKNLILNVISKAASAIGDIMKAPIKFLGNFMSAIKQGVTRFSDGILKHLKKGLMDWLFGALGANGIDVPESFDVPGMLKVVLQVLGLTWDTLRASFVKHIGEPGVAALEKGSDIVQQVISQGPIALGTMLLEKFGDFEEMVLGKIKEFVVGKVITEGIKFFVSMLNPASAFIKACKMIYDIIMWLIDNGGRIAELINTIIDSIVDIAKGGIGGVPEKIEGVLVKLLPLAIGFLASIIGLGGVGDKVRSIVDRVRAPLRKATDKVVKSIVDATKAIWQPAKRLYAKGKAKVKDLAEKGTAKLKQSRTWATKKVGQVKNSILRALGLPRQEPATMAGESHTVSLEKAGGGIALTMASKKGDILAKIAAEKRLAEADGDPARIKAVGGLATLAVKVLEEGKMAVGAKDDAEARDRAKKVQTRLRALAKALAAYGKSFSRPDLGVAGMGPKLDDSQLKRSSALVLAAEADAVAGHADARKDTLGVKEASKIAKEARKLDGNTASTAGSRLKVLRTQLTAVKSRLGIEGGEGELYTDDPSAGVCGEVGPHSQQGSRGRASSPKYLHLESEHVIPRDWINNYLMHFHNRAVSNDFYHAMTTVMLYKTASNRKTVGSPPPPGDLATGAMHSSDNETAKQCKKVLAGGTEGATTSYREALLRALPKLLTGRIDATMAAIKADVADKRQCDLRAKKGKPLGATRAQVELAASQQLKQLEKYIKDGEGRADPAGKLTEVRLDFDMGPVDHTLYYTPPAKLEMASKRGPLVNKLEASLIALTDKKNPSTTEKAQAKDLKGILIVAKSVEEAGVVADRLTDNQLLSETTPPALANLQQLLDRLLRELDQYGDRWRKTDLPKEGELEEDSEVDVPLAEGKTAEDLADTALYKKYGMPTANALHAMEVAARFGVVLLVRPTSPQVPVLLERGLVPKPEAVKAKTINAKDVVLGARAGLTKDDLGKVGWFAPQLPAAGSKEETVAGDLLPRYGLRLKERADEMQKVTKLLHKKRIRIVEGKIVDVKSGKEMTGDHDLYAVLDASEQPLVDQPGETTMFRKKEAVVAALRSGSFNAQHGALLDWKPKNASEQRIFDVIIRAKEQLLKITASGCSVATHKPQYLAAED